nr:DUF2516 family protein [Spelaeicoccus albus]
MLLALSLVALGMELFALVEAARHSGDSFERAGKRTKTFWVSILAGATFVGVLALPLFVGIMPYWINVIAVVFAGVFLADVRPAIRINGPGRTKRTGPYGGW